MIFDSVMATKHISVALKSLKSESHEIWYLSITIWSYFER
jgi:hypothetical protein